MDDLKEEFIRFNKLLNEKNFDELENFPDIEKYLNGIVEYPNRYQLPLFFHLMRKNRDVCEFLIRKGADVNKMFMYTRESTDNDNIYPILSALISFEADDAGGEETIKEAKKLFNDTSMIQLLINNNVDINKPTEGGYTPLDWAFIVDRKKVEKLLLKYGAKHSKRFADDMKKRNFDVQDYLDIPYIDKTPPKFHKEIKIEFELHKEQKNRPLTTGFLDNVVARGENINGKDWMGRTPLDFAIEIGNNVAEEYLREKGAKTSKELEND